MERRLPDASPCYQNYLVRVCPESFTQFIQENPENDFAGHLHRCDVKFKEAWACLHSDHRSRQSATGEIKKQRI
jgi:hypothetical protein